MSDISKLLINNLDIALIAFNSDGELIFYNKKAQTIWELEDDIFTYKPNIIEFYEILRETGKYPEKDDFRQYVQDVYNKLSQKISQKNQYKILLNDSTTLTEIHKYSDLGVLITWEDSTEEWNNTYALNSFKNIYNRIITNNPNPVLIISSTGIIENYNGKFMEEFSINANELDSSIHIRELVHKIDILKNDPNHISNIIGYCVSNRSFIYNATLENDNLRITGISLPNGTMFVIFETYFKNNNAFDISSLPEPLVNNINHLQNELLIDLGSVIINPITSIIGFADMLQNEYVGSLNIRQKDYISNILNTAENVNSELYNKISLINLEKLENIENEELDIIFCISDILHSIKPKIQQKNIKLNLEYKDIEKNINSNKNLLCKAIILLFNYMLEQNNYNSEIFLNLSQDNYGTHILIKDTSKNPLLSKEDMLKRYDLKLSLAILDRLKITIQHSYKNKSYRELLFSIV